MGLFFLPQDSAFLAILQLVHSLEWCNFFSKLLFSFIFGEVIVQLVGSTHIKNWSSAMLCMAATAF